MLSFPRDLYVPIPAGRHRQDQRGVLAGGTDMTIETVEQLTGEPVNYYVNIDFTGFAQARERGRRRLPRRRPPLLQHNPARGTGTTPPIDLQPGYQRLNGADALDYVRYRHTDSDYARDRAPAAVPRPSSSARPRSSATSRTSPSLQQDLRQEHRRSTSPSPRTFLSLLELALVTPKETHRAGRRSRARTTMIDGRRSVQIAAQARSHEAVAEWKDPSFEQRQRAARQAARPVARST